MLVPWHIQALKIDQVWKKLGVKGQGVKIALLDTGIASNKGLNGKNIFRLNQVGKKSRLGDSKGHGTMCASVIASRLKVAPGIAPNATIYSLKVSNTRGQISLTNVIRAFKTAEKLKCDIINCSFVLPKVNVKLLKAIKASHQRGAFTIASAGNHRDINATFPEKVPFAITVAATTIENKPMPNAKIGNWIDISAPGESIVSISPGKGITNDFGGTSAAAAIVTAVIALILSHAKKTNSVDAVTAVLLKNMAMTAMDIGPRKKDKFSGAGTINPVRLIQSFSD